MSQTFTEACDDLGRGIEEIYDKALFLKAENKRLRSAKLESDLRASMLLETLRRIVDAGQTTGNLRFILDLSHIAITKATNGVKP